MKKLLYKSEDNKMLEGVCAGVAEYFDLDPTLVRASYAFVTVITGVIPGLVAYIVLAVIMPKKSAVKKESKETK